MLAAGLCGVAGMLPDLDSDSGVPVRETFAFAAAIVPMLLVDRLERMGTPHDLIVFTGFLVYIAIRFGVSQIFKRYTVHRGMWHSLPAAASVGLLTFLLVTGDSTFHRLYLAGAVVLGFLVHLLLDELWSIQWKGGRVRLKSSFGTAIKLWSRSWWANLSTYGKLVLLIVYAVHFDPIVMEQLDQRLGRSPLAAQQPPSPRQSPPQPSPQVGDVAPQSPLLR
jgi:hypothetical protein